MLVIYMRHGETTKAADGKVSNYDAPLTLEGKFQAARTTKYIKNENIACVYAAPSIRTRQTAEIVAKKIHAPLVIVDGLRERIGIKKEDIKSVSDQEFFDNYLNRNYKNNEKETCEKYIKRNFEIIDDIIKKHKDKNQNVLIVGHSSMLYALSAYFHGLQKDGDVIWMQCSNCATVKFSTDHCSTK